ncbi:MAG: hypothetical protein PHO08_04780 [Methylococcales bacterium]|nr:hypothetical protein [Methylococcales bacterium]MDD5631679.1 hypothetical protein [Methylococcales bacterium]
MAENNNRWWEFYLTRYLAANIFAVLVLFYLVAFHGTAIQKSLCPNGFDLQLCKGGFSTEVYGFIYQTTKNIASIDREDEAKFKGFEFASDKKYGRHLITITEINFANIFILGVFGFLYMYISSIPIYFLHITRHYDSSGVFGFLKKSTKQRSRIEEKYDIEFAPEYITSYKHMREHGNAFGIILMEILFAWLLVLSDFSLFLVMSWLFLGFSGWFLGIYLEFKMVGENCADFLIGTFLFFYILSLLLFHIRP